MKYSAILISALFIKQQKYAEITRYMVLHYYCDYLQEGGITYNPETEEFEVKYGSKVRMPNPVKYTEDQDQVPKQENLGHLDKEEKLSHIHSHEEL